MMTKEQATEFERYSVTNAAILQGAAAARGCACAPYQDWYTFRRWIAQGYVVRKGEHGVKISTYAPITKKDDDGETVTVGKRPWTSTVFCRCQVSEKGEPAAEPAPAVDLDAQADAVWRLQHPEPETKPEPDPEPEPAPAKRGVNISHDFPMPRNRDIRCQQGHVSKAICESPIFCRQCHTAAVVWVAPKTVKTWAPGRIGVGA